MGQRIFSLTLGVLLAAGLVACNRQDYFVDVDGSVPDAKINYHVDLGNPPERDAAMCGMFADDCSAASPCCAGFVCNSHPVHGHPICMPLEDAGEPDATVVVRDAALPDAALADAALADAASTVVDECDLNTDDCGVGERCIDEIDGYSCIPCPSGFTSDGSAAECVDIDECTLGTADCGVNEWCRNTDGDFACMGLHTIVAANYYNTCSVGDGKCWGANWRGVLGQGDTTDRGAMPDELWSMPPIDFGTPSSITSIEFAGNYGAACALFENGGVKCWGTNSRGLLGSNTSVAGGWGDEPGEMGSSLAWVQLGTGRSAVQLAAGSGSFCALLDDDTLKCWGSNGAGRLGLGDGDERGDDAGEMGDALPTVNLGTGRRPLFVSVGGQHACVIDDEHQVVCWGDGSYGQLGYETDDGNSAVGDDPGEMGDALMPVALGTGRTAIGLAVGDTSTCALLDDHTVKCWGDNDRGELGYGDRIGRGNSPTDMGDALPSVNLGTGRHALAIRGSSRTYCAVLDDQSIKCWGDNHFGQLGQGDTLNRGDDPNEMGDFLPPINLDPGGYYLSDVRIGYTHACVVFEESHIKCWGGNAYGQLGYGDTNDRGDEPSEMGSMLGWVDDLPPP